MHSNVILINLFVFLFVMFTFFGGIGTVCVGKITSGVLKTNMLVSFSPGNFTSEVKSIQMHHVQVLQGNPGDNVGFNIKNKEMEDIRSGMVVSDAKNDPAGEVESFIAKVIIFTHPGTIKVGYSPIVDCHTAHVACEIEEIKERVDRKTGESVEKNPKTIKGGEAAIVKMRPKKRMSVEEFKEYPALGRFAMRDLKQTIGVGVVLSIIRVDPQIELVSFFAFC